jgi:Uma2 family endonuclease
VTTGPRRAVSSRDVAIDDWNAHPPDVVVLSSPPDDATSCVGIPLLVVEVLAPSTASRDRGVKARRLLASGVSEVRLVDPGAREVVALDASGPRPASGSEALPSRALPGFALVPDHLSSPAAPTPPSTGRRTT